MAISSEPVRAIDRPLLSPAMVWVLSLLALAFAGFFQTYFGRFPRFEDTSIAIHFHVAILLVWFAFALVQTVLVRRGRTDLHRRVGKLAYVIVPLMFVGFVFALDDGQHRHKNPVLILATFFDAGLFLAYVCLGLLHRRQPMHHRAYMILALVPFINPPLARLISPKLSIPVELAVIVTLLVRARLRKAPTRPYAIGLALFIASLVGLMMALTVWPDVPDRLFQAMFGA